MCGEKRVKSSRNSIMTGSPPHVRGKVFIGYICVFVGRITPACAGKSAKDYTLFKVAKGSPPHVRGKVSICIVVPGELGITPACAGKSQIHQHRAE